MASRPLIIASLLGASIGVPYFASKSNNGDGAAPNAVQPSPSAATATTSPQLLGGTPSPATTLARTSGPSIAASSARRSPSVEQALRFNVTKEWVYRSWDRKSSGPTDLGLFAVRVPMVSGTQSGSLAGALTYYFNTQDQVEHISFRGRTGDPARLVRFLIQTYQFQPVAGQPGEQVYQVADRGGVISELRTQPEPIVAGASPHGAHSVELELARPGSERYLPPRGPFLYVPQTPDVQAQAAAAAAAASTDSNAADAASGGSYLDRIRYATPEEAGPMQWNRWPN